MLNNIKILIKDLIKTQKILIIILTPIWIFLLYFQKVKQLAISEVLFVMVIMFILYGFKHIKYAKIYNLAYKIFSNDDILLKKYSVLLFKGSFAINIFWNMMTILFITYLLTNINANIFYFAYFILFLCTLISAQNNYYFNELINDINLRRIENGFF